MRRRVLVTISGQVQGVGFRRWTEREALARECVGWVKNESDGSVQALVEGDQARVAELLTALRRGPSGARVESVSVHESPPEPEEFCTFSILTSK
jgi:acylphosphatase